MSGRTKAQRRACKGELNLYPANTTLGWRVIGTTTSQRAAAKLARGEWREVYDDSGNLLGYQILATFSTDKDLPSGESSSSITASESQLNAGVVGVSHTEGLSEDERVSRRNKWQHALPPEDAVERAREKVKIWVVPASRIDDGKGEPVFGDRAVRCYPKPCK